MATDFKQKLHTLLASFENKASNNFKPELTGYVPGGKSGVTIATGFDLGQHNAADIKKLKLPKALEAKLLPFAKSKDKVKAKTLTITEAEATAIDNAVINSKTDSFATAYKNKFGTAPEQALDENTRLALTSSFFNMGPNIFDEEKNPSMVKAIKSGDSKQIHQQIADFHKGGSTQPLSRRLAEAAVASGFIDATDPTGISNFKDLMSKNPEARTAYRQNWNNIELTPAPKTSDQQIPYPVNQPDQFDSMKDLLRSLGEKVSSVIPSAQSAEVSPMVQAQEARTQFAQQDPRRVDVQAEPQYATMEELLGKRNILSNDLLYPPMP